MKKVGIVGGSGYTGVELLRILLRHQDIELTTVCSRTNAGMRVDQYFPSLRGFTDLLFTDPVDADLQALDLVFFATPNATAMHSVPALLKQGVKVVDLSADFRIQDASVWQTWYGQTHACPELLPKAVYGLPEIHRDRIRNAELVANPGCYPTCIQLGFMPLLEAGIVDRSTLIADAKSGVSGAGRGASVATLHAEVSDNFKAYGVAGHRHLPEIEQGLLMMGEGPVSLTFTPHLLPIVRGIHATLYATLRDESLSEEALQSLFEDRFRDELFVDVMPQGSHPETRSVRGANTCRLAVHRPQNRATVVILAVEDNLVKGAAGQAVQNMNLMLGCEERAGLEILPLQP